MADQAVATTVVDGDGRGSSDRMLPKALDLMDTSATRLYEAGRELKKRPILQRAVEGVAFRLSEAAADFGPRALEFSAGKDDRERFARQEIAELMRVHVVRLHDCDLRRWLMDRGHELRYDGPIPIREDKEVSDVDRLRAVVSTLEEISEGFSEEYPWRDACERFVESARRTLARYDDPESEEAAPEESSSPLPRAADGIAHLAEGLSRSEVLLLCELATTRDRIELDWDRLEAAKKESGTDGAHITDPSTRDEGELLSATIDHQHRALRLIRDGRVDAVAAAEAALSGSKGGE